MQVKIGFSQGSTWIAKLICAVTRSNISHSFFYVEDAQDAWAYEAVLGGFRKIPWSVYVSSNRVLSIIDVEWTHQDVKLVLDSMLGTKYALRSFLIKGGALLIFKRIVKNPRKFLSNEIDCVTSVVQVMNQHTRINLEDVITPAELQEKIQREK